MNYFRINLPWRGGFGLVLAALVAGALFLWLGIAVAIGSALLAGVALLRNWVRSWWAPPARGPVTLEGECTRSEP